MNSIALRLEQVRVRIAAAVSNAGRHLSNVRLIAVSKTQPAAALREAYSQGQRDFGENYLQEALSKQAELADLDIVWHFIGPIQSNKTRALASHFQWVHTLDRLKIAQRLSEQRPAELPPLNVCIQVNISSEETKSGISLTELPALANAVAKLPRLKLRGLMAIPAPTAALEQQRAAFSTLRKAMENLHIDNLDTLSMGMSDDLEAAIGEGSTMVRIGTAIFGKRLT